MLARIHKVAAVVVDVPHITPERIDAERERGSDFYRRRVTAEPEHYGVLHIVQPGASHYAAWKAVTR